MPEKGSRAGKYGPGLKSAVSHTIPKMHKAEPKFDNTPGFYGGAPPRQRASG
eukprot:gene3947-9289_t